MRWNKKPEKWGATVHKDKFAWFPTLCGDVWVWLEFYSAEVYKLGFLSDIILSKRIKKK